MQQEQIYIKRQCIKRQAIVTALYFYLHLLEHDFVLFFVPLSWFHCGFILPYNSNAHDPHVLVIPPR